MSVVRLAVGATASWIVAVVAGALVALAMGPSIASAFGASIRDPGDLNVLPLLLGYGVITLQLALLWWVIRPERLAMSAALGFVLGLAVFLGGHMVITGWAVMPFKEMAISGALDAFAVAAGAMAMHMIVQPGAMGGRA